MIIRACLCALDWNHNVNRPHKLDEFGKAMYREKVATKSYRIENFPYMVWCRWTGQATPGPLYQSWWIRTQAGRTRLWTFVWPVLRVATSPVLSILLKLFLQKDQPSTPRYLYSVCYIKLICWAVPSSVQFSPKPSMVNEI